MIERDIVVVEGVGKGEAGEHNELEWIAFPAVECLPWSRCEAVAVCGVPVVHCWQGP